jgi:nucleotide-binding universal stress UspA family protein
MAESRSGVGDPIEARMQLLVPILRAQTATAVLSVADALSASNAGQGHVLGVVEVPRADTDNLGAQVAQRRHDLLRWIAAIDAHKPGVHSGLAIQMRVCHNVSLGIREAVYENGSNLILIEWPGLSSRRPRLLSAVLDDLASEPPADLLLVRPGTRTGSGPLAVQRVLVPVRGGPNARLALLAGVALGEVHQAEVTALHIYGSEHHPKRRAAEVDLVHNLLGQFRYPRLDLVEKDAQNVGEVIRDESEGYDVIVLGAYAEATQPQVLVQSLLTPSLRQLEGTVILAKSAGRLT